MQDQQPLCRGGCGFYGTSANNGYCSICHVSHNTKATAVLNPALKTKESIKNSTELLSGLFHRVGQTVKGLSILDKPVVAERLSKEEFATLMRQPELADVVAKIKLFLQDFAKNSSAIALDEQGAVVHNFLSELAGYLPSHPVFRTASFKQDIDFIMEGVERHVMTKIYKIAFGSEEDQRRDLQLREKISSLQWITLRHLANESESILSASQTISERLNDACAELLRINAKRLPADKMLFIDKCCTAIFHACESPIGGDDFLSLLVYTIIMANPPKLCCAIAFIESMQHTHINMTEAEFQRNILWQQLLNDRKELHVSPESHDIRRPLVGVQERLSQGNLSSESLSSAMQALRESQAQLLVALQHIKMPDDLPESSSGLLFQFVPNLETPSTLIAAESWTSVIDGEKHHVHIAHIEEDKSMRIEIGSEHDISHSTTQHPKDINHANIEWVVTSNTNSLSLVHAKTTDDDVGDRISAVETDPEWTEWASAPQESINKVQSGHDNDDFEWSEWIGAR